MILTMSACSLTVWAKLSDMNEVTAMSQTWPGRVKLPYLRAIIQPQCMSVDEGRPKISTPARTHLRMAIPGDKMADLAHSLRIHARPSHMGCRTRLKLCCKRGTFV